MLAHSLDSVDMPRGFACSPAIRMSTRDLIKLSIELCRLMMVLWVRLLIMLSVCVFVQRVHLDRITNGVRRASSYDLSVCS